MAPSIDEHIGALELDGRLLAEAAASSSLEAAVPSCPGWTLSNLIAHTGSVHRWARRYVAEGLMEMVPETSDAEMAASNLSDAELIDWFSAGHAALVDSLRAADPGLSCWTFLRAPSPLAFWARRQAHETAIHRVDAQLAAGRQITPFKNDFAADGVDELLVEFMGGRRLDGDSEDAGAEGMITVGDRAGNCWLVSLNAGRRRRQLEPVAGECSVAGEASDLYLLFWNRIRPEDAPFEIGGDARLLERWRVRSTVRWS
jgi:uncharacterized protein (TIGR03083 family)